MPIKFVLGGKDITLTREAVEAAVSNQKPERIHKYWVRIEENDFPIKQVVSLASKVPLAAFITTDAYRILSKLGFEVMQ